MAYGNQDGLLTSQHAAWAWPGGGGVPGCGECRRCTLLARIPGKFAQFAGFRSCCYAYFASKMH